jgi:hypothetical protein
VQSSGVACARCVYVCGGFVKQGWPSGPWRLVQETVRRYDLQSSGVVCVRCVAEWAVATCRNSQEVWSAIVRSCLCPLCVYVCGGFVNQGWPSGPWRLASRRTSTPTIASTGCFSTRKTCTMWLPEPDAIMLSRLGGSSAYCGRESDLAQVGFTFGLWSEQFDTAGPVWDPVNCQLFYVRWYLRLLWGLFGGQTR